MHSGKVIPAKREPPSIQQVKDAMTLFARNRFDTYDDHMHRTGHYAEQTSLLSLADGEGHVKGRKIVDIGGGTGGLLSHLLLSTLATSIVEPKENDPPVRLYNVDATPEMMERCHARLLRRLSALISKAQESRGKNGFVVYGFDAETGDPRRYSQEGMTQRRQERLDGKVKLYQKLTPDAEARIGPDYVTKIDCMTLRELLTIELVMEDVTSLSEAKLRELQGADTVIVSYCFHWFIDKPRVAAIIRDILGDYGRFVSLEEWPLRVTIPEHATRRERRFFGKLAMAIENATTPIEVPGELYSLFGQAGFEPVLLGGAEPYVKNRIDMHHDMYLGVFGKTQSGLYVPRQ